MSLKETYSICCIADSKGRTLPYTLVQYLFKGEEHKKYVKFDLMETQRRKHPTGVYNRVLVKN